MNYRHSFLQHNRAQRELELLNRETRRAFWAHWFFSAAVVGVCLSIMGLICHLHFPERTAALMQELRSHLPAIALP